MAQANRASKGKRPSKAVSVLGIAGMSLAASTGGSPADIPPASLTTPNAGSVADILWQNAAPFKIPSLDEEEISDVSLATFYLFDKENPGNPQSGIQVAFDRLRLRTRLRRLRRQRLRRLSRLRRRSRLRRWLSRLQRLRRWLSRLRLWRLRRLRRLRLGLGLGRRLLLVMGRLRALLDRSAVLLP